MNLITIKTFDTAIEAHNLKNRLEVEDIETYIYDEHLIGLNPLYSNAIGGVKVKIKASYLEQANFVLNAIENNVYFNDEKEILTCSGCDSSNINTDYRDFKNLSGVLSFFVSLILFVYPIYFKRKCKCNSCGLEFDRELMD